MTPAEIKLVQRTFWQVAPHVDWLAELFYERLFAARPDYRRLFKPDAAAQRDKRMATLGAVVSGLDRLDRILPSLAEMGRRHTGYGVQPADYAPVGTALLDALATVLGRDFTPEVRSAWTQAYGALADALIEGARQPTPA